MSNIAGKAYAMNVVTPMKRWGAFIQRLIFMLARALPSRLNGLMGLHLIHFARWVLIRRDQWPDLGQGKQTLKYDYMLFCSNFNALGINISTHFLTLSQAALISFGMPASNIRIRFRSRRSRITSLTTRSIRTITIMRRLARLSETSRRH
ncbi:MAG: hypothetical protein WDN46_01085 [Methylocella sp.]